MNVRHGDLWGCHLCGGRRVAMAFMNITGSRTFYARCVRCGHNPRRTPGSDATLMAGSVAALRRALGKHDILVRLREL